MPNLEALGTQLQITEDFYNRLPKTLTYNADGTVNTITATGNFAGTTVSFVKTLTWVAGNLTSESEWVKQ